MRHESRWSMLAALVAGIAPVLVLVGCGGAETPEGAGVVDAEGVATTGPERTGVAKPRGTDEVYEEIVRALDSAYSDLGSPPADLDHLSEVQDIASEQLAGIAFEWPPGTSYLLSVLDDRVAVYINCDGKEKRGDWIPGGEVEQPG